jgi:hypothetical protein
VEPFVLVVMEHASPWHTEVAGGTGACVVLKQEVHEDAGELLRRAYERIRAIERIGGAISVAVLCCSDEPGRTAFEERIPLARALLATLLRTGAGRLELVARSSAPDRTRHSLLALAGTLTECLAGSSASVSVRFLGPASFDSDDGAHERSERSADEGRSAA